MLFTFYVLFSDKYTEGQNMKINTYFIVSFSNTTFISWTYAKLTIVSAKCSRYTRVRIHSTCKYVHIYIIYGNVFSPMFLSLLLSSLLLQFVVQFLFLHIDILNMFYFRTIFSALWSSEVEFAQVRKNVNSTTDNIV